MTTRTIRRGAAASALALALLAGACSSDEASTDTDTGSTEAEGSGAGADLDLVADDQLTVCSDVPYAPFEMEDESTDSGYTGFDIELLEAIAADLGLTVTVKDLPFDGILGALPAGDCDIVGSAVSITPEREEQVLFSESYFDSKQSLMVLAENEEAYPDLESLAGKTIGVQSGTTGATYAEDLSAGEDLAFQLELVFHPGGAPPVRVPRPMYYYREGESTRAANQAAAHRLLTERVVLRTANPQFERWARRAGPGRAFVYQRADAQFEAAGRAAPQDVVAAAVEVRSSAARGYARLVVGRGLQALAGLADRRFRPAVIADIERQLGGP